MPTRRASDMAAMLLIGDGIAALVAPRARTQLWREGPPTWRNLMGFLERRPGLTMTVGLAEAAVGIWLVRRTAARVQLPDHHGKATVSHG